MRPRTQKAREHRKRVAVAMALSVAVHGAILAFASLSVPPFPSPAERVAKAAGEPDRYAAQRPLEVVQLRRTEQAASAGAAREPAPAGRPNAVRQPGAASRIAVRPMPGTPAASLSLDRAQPRAEGTPVLESLLASAEGAARSVGALDAEVDFRPASAAARDAQRGRRDGRDRPGRGGFGGGITILVGGAGGDCDGGPGTAIIDRFVGPLGSPGGVIGRR